jgi:universal stress protein E
MQRDSFKKILVIPNADEPNQPVVRRALLCADSTTDVEVFDAVYEALLEGYLGNKGIYERLRSRVLRERLDRVQALAKVFTNAGHKASATALWDHPLDRVIAREAAAKGADLVVTAPMQSHVGGLSHSDWQLVLTCPAPVLLVKSDGAPRYRHIVAAVDPFHTHAKPADLDSLILSHAKRLQKLTGAGLTVMHCFTPMGHFGADLSESTIPPDTEPQDREHALHGLLRDAGIDPTAARLVAGAPHAVLEEMVERDEADLIVMGALARGRLAHLIVGSTAERVLHRSSADVFVVKPPTAT